MNELILELAHTLGLTPRVTLLILAVTPMICNAVTRAIPDNVEGPLKYVRLMTKIIGLHVKDNSGVPAIKSGDGVAVRQAVADTIPEPVEDFIESQGTLQLTDADRWSPFKQGAAAREQERG